MSKSARPAPHRRWTDVRRRSGGIIFLSLGLWSLLNGSDAIGRGRDLRKVQEASAFIAELEDTSATEGAPADANWQGPEKDKSPGLDLGLPADLNPSERALQVCGGTNITVGILCIFAGVFSLFRRIRSLAFVTAGLGLFSSVLWFLWLEGSPWSLGLKALLYIGGTLAILVGIPSPEPDIDHQAVGPTSAKGIRPRG